MAPERNGDGSYRLVGLAFPYASETGAPFRERYPSLGAPYPPSVGNSPVLGSEASQDWLGLSAIGGGLVLLTLVLLRAGPRRLER